MEKLCSCQYPKQAKPTKFLVMKFDFNKVAQNYDDYYHSEFGKKIDDVEKRLVKKYLNKIPDKEALEIGCGTGHWSMFFSDNGFQITGIDLASDMLAKAIDKDIPGAVFMEMDAENLMFPSESIKNIFGFFPGNIFLYKLALTHKSVATEIKEGVKDSNERLEYLGDAILGSIVADYLFKKFPFKDEGFLTETRSKIVSRAQLNNLSIRLGLNKLIESASNSNSQNGKSINGDAFEAFIGAMYLDKGFAFAHRIVTENIIKVHLDLDELVEKEVNFKSKLIEWAQKERKEIEFKVIKEQGSGNTKQYISKVFIDGVPHEQGVDFSIKGAEKLAAEKTFQQLSLNVDDL